MPRLIPSIIALRAVHRALVLLVSSALLLQMALAQTPASANGPAATNTPTLQITSRLAFLDVTVLDPKGRPIVKGLSKDDFFITEENRPQRIASFEPPETHVASAADSAGPATIFVLDQLNSTVQDMAYIRFRLQKYLEAQPDVLPAPAEILLLSNKSLEMLQDFTRSRAELLDALDSIPPAFPYKLGPSSFYIERVAESINALQQIALQNKGVPGRKNIVWIGHGGPGLSTATLTGNSIDKLNQYIHDTSNMLVDARMTLFLIYPGLPAGGPGAGRSELTAKTDLGEDDPFAENINFGVFVNETGGTLFYNRNDVDAEIKRSVELGSQYYTLTYQPPDGTADGKFRRVRVTLRDPSLRVMTKAGYFAAAANTQTDPRSQTIFSLDQAARSTIPFTALQMTVEKVIRHPDTGTAELLIDLSSSNLGWQSAPKGGSTTDIAIEALSLSNRRNPLAWKTQSFTLTANTQEPARRENGHIHLAVSLRVPPKTTIVRLAIGVMESGRTGAVEVDRKTIDASPEAPTPETRLSHRPSS